MYYHQYKFVKVIQHFFFLSKLTQFKFKLIMMNKLLNHDMNWHAYKQFQTDSCFHKL